MAVVDIFGGSGATGEACEQLGRRWKTIDLSREYIHASALRFVADWADRDVTALHQRIAAGRIEAIVPRQMLLA